MIFALDETGEISVLSDLAETRKHCEAIDVESGVWRFFDDDGRPLEAVFSRPNKVSKLFWIISSIEPGEFLLKPAVAKSTPSLLQALDATSAYMNDTSRFHTLEDLRAYLNSRTANAPT
jgi:hypothetical protein